MGHTLLINFMQQQQQKLTPPTLVCSELPLVFCQSPSYINKDVQVASAYLPYTHKRDSPICRQDLTVGGKHQELAGCLCRCPPQRPFYLSFFWVLEELRGQVSCLASGRGAVKGSPELLAPQILELFLPFNLHSRLPPSHCLQPFGGRAKHCLGISARINLLWLYLHLSVFVSHLNSDIYWHKCAMESQFGEKRQYLL